MKQAGGHQQKGRRAECMVWCQERAMKEVHAAILQQIHDGQVTPVEKPGVK
ncbi:MAG: hypothetical protein WC485_06280 [Opitutaceae bacterium]